jgi:hypothetical protein
MSAPPCSYRERRRERAKGRFGCRGPHDALQFPAPASGFGFNTARLGFGRLQVRLGLRYAGAVVVILDFDQHFAFFDAAKILGQVDRSIALDRDNPPAYWVKSGYLTMTRRPNEALRAADAVLAIDPNYATLLAQRSNAESE